MNCLLFPHKSYLSLRLCNSGYKLMMGADAGGSRHFNDQKCTSEGGAEAQIP